MPAAEMQAVEIKSTVEHLGSSHPMHDFDQLLTFKVLHVLKNFFIFMTIYIYVIVNLTF